MLELAPWTYCWSPPSGAAGVAAGQCADGAAPDELEALSGPRPLVVSFPLPGWRFEATFTTVGMKSGACSRRQVVPLAPIDSTSFALAPHGYAGDYDVSLFGRSAADATPGGDVSVSFRWLDSGGGPLAEPTARASILADNQGRTDSYGVEVDLENLRATPARATAQAEIVPASGPTAVVALARQDNPCSPEGTIRFTGDRTAALDAAGAGTRPYRYVVTVTLDGRRYRADATWPNDVDPVCSPCVPLTFQPPLPALQPR